MTRTEHIAYWFGRRIGDGEPMVPMTIERFIGRDCQTTLELIAGLFDRGGAVKIAGDGRTMLVFSNARREIVECVASILERSGVQVGPIKDRKVGYRTEHEIHPDLESFREAGFFLRDEKKKRQLSLASETLHTAPPEAAGEDKVQPSAKADGTPASGGRNVRRRTADRSPGSTPTPQ
jgi:hypothetical protein